MSSERAKGERYAHTSDVPDGFWVRDGQVFEKRADMMHATGFAFAGRMVGVCYPATEPEIASFVAAKAKREAEDQARRDEWAALMEPFGVSPADFVRFRSCWVEEGVLHVETRENGVNERSIAAIKKGNVLRAYSDDGDSTYEHYEFALPEQPSVTP